ncbi:hypothetical protein PS2_023173 [Malus domestica]
MAFLCKNLSDSFSMAIAKAGGYLARLVVPDGTIIMLDGNGVFLLILTSLPTDSTCLPNSHHLLQPRVGLLRPLPLEATVRAFDVAPINHWRLVFMGEEVEEWNFNVNCKS